MRVVQFTIPTMTDSSIHVQEDELPHFYEHLHRHKEVQMTWIIEGEGTLVTGTGMNPFKAGDYYLLGANQPHLFKSDPGYFFPESKKRIHTLNIFFDMEGFIASLLSLPEMFSVRKFINQAHNGLKAPDENVQVITDYMLKVKNTSAGYRISSFVELLQLMSGMKGWQTLTDTTSKEMISESEGLRMNDIYQYSLDNFKKRITLDEIAAVACMTPQSFCRYFKKHTLKTYTHFINELRINEACRRMLAVGRPCMSDLAYESGYVNVVTFNRVFKSIKGCSPREFLSRYRENLQNRLPG